jgi:hypothetical protein
MGIPCQRGISVGHFVEVCHGQSTQNVMGKGCSKMFVENRSWKAPPFPLTNFNWNCFMYRFLALNNTHVFTLINDFAKGYVHNK